MTHIAEPTALDLFGEPDPSTKGRRTRWLIAIVVVIVLAAAAAAGWWYVRQRDKATATVSIKGADGSQTVTIADGKITLAQLQSELSKRGADSLLTTTSDGGVFLTADLTVGTGGSLTVNGAALLLRSDPQRAVRVTAQDGGRLTLNRSTVVSWDGLAVDNAPADGRASIIATGESSQLNVRDSSLSYLGSTPNDPGLSWRNGALGTLSDSTLSHNFRGADGNRSGPLTVTGSTFTSSLDDGLSLQFPAAGSIVTSSTFNSNVGAGLSVRAASAMTLGGITANSNGAAGVSLSASTGVTVTGLQAGSNKTDGVTLDDSQGSRVTASTIWNNNAGITVSGGVATIDNNTLSANVADGILLTQAGTNADVKNNQIDHNARSGLWMAGQVTATMTGNAMDKNDTGVHVSAAGTITMHTNTISTSAVDGIALAVPDDPGITGNTISNSTTAAFSLPVAGDITALTSANTVIGVDRKLSRVRGVSPSDG